MQQKNHSLRPSGVGPYTKVRSSILNVLFSSMRRERIGDKRTGTHAEDLDTREIYFGVVDDGPSSLRK